MTACPRCSSHWKVTKLRGGLRWHECRECGASWRECNHERLGLSDIIECMICGVILHEFPATERPSS